VSAAWAVPLHVAALSRLRPESVTPQGFDDVTVFHACNHDGSLVPLNLQWKGPLDTAGESIQDTCRRGQTSVVRLTHGARTADHNRTRQGDLLSVAADEIGSVNPSWPQLTV